MPFSPDFIEELHERNDIVETIGASVPLKRAGSTYKGLCPFHNEKTPSFVVYPSTRSFYCFGCQKGGDVISFVMESEHLGYLEAVKQLAARAGIAVPDEADDKTSRLKIDILSANRDAARFFFTKLNSDEGTQARGYLRRRGLSNDTIVRFGIGYAPDSWGELTEHMTKKGHSSETLRQAGLCARGRNGDYDVFRNRIIFPIIDVRGNVVAFGGRRLNEADRAKYVNTSDTPVYKKSRNLYALNIAKANPERRIIIAEGYLDVIALHQASFTSAVAALGTALTPEQAHLIRQYADEVVLCYDADEAGQKATRRAIEILKPTGLLVKVVTVENAKDPDEYIRTAGAESFRRLLDDSGTSVEYELKKAKQQVDISTAAGKVEYLKSAVTILSKLESQPEIEVYASQVAQVLDITAQSVVMQVGESRKRIKSKAEKQAHRALNNEVTESLRSFKGDKSRETPAAFYIERRLFSVLCANPDYVGEVAKLLKPEDFLSEDMGKVYSAILSKHSESAFGGYYSLSGEISEYMMSQLAMWLASTSGINSTAQDAVMLAQQVKKNSNKPVESDIANMSPEEIMQIIKQNNSEVKKQCRKTRNQ